MPPRRTPLSERGAAPHAVPHEQARRLDDSAVDSKTAHREGPVRTCVGCRARAMKPALLRVVVADGALTVDHAGCLPGRGASVHPDLACVDLADKRRAFARALRVAGPLDVTPVRVYVQSRGSSPPSSREQVEKL